MLRAIAGEGRRRDNTGSLIHEESAKIQQFSHMILEVWISSVFLWVMHFKAEQTGEDKYRYTNHCGKGKMAVSLNTDYSRKIQELYSGNTWDSKEFLKNIRQHNSGLAFALVQSNVEGFPSTRIY